MSVDTNTRGSLELDAVDIYALKDAGEKIQMDLEEDAFSYSAPPPKGPYRLKIFKDQNGWRGPKKKGTKDEFVKPGEKDFYLFCGLECKVVSDNPDYDGSTVYANISTRIGRGKSISTCMGLMIKMGLKKQDAYSRLTHIEQAKLFDQIVKGERILEVDLDWKGQYKDPGQGPGGSDYVPVARKYEDFPELPDKSGRMHIYQVNKPKGGTEEVRANVFVAQWYGKGETRQDKKLQQQGAPGMMLLDDEALAGVVVSNGPTAPAQVTPQATNAVPKPPAPVETDLALILE